MGINYELTAVVNAGSIIDFAVSPGPSSNDYRDLTRFTAVITLEPTTLSLLFFSSLTLLRRRTMP